MITTRIKRWKAKMASPSSSDSDEIDLDMSASSSSFDEEEILQYEDEEEEANEEPVLGILPYQFEPLAEEEPGADERIGQVAEAGGDGVAVARMNNLEWCLCGHCGPMPTEAECVCCREIQEVDDRRTEQEDTACITQHEGFEPVCLNRHVLRVAYFQYRQQFGGREGHAIHEQYRYTAYRQLVRWCWGFLGRHVRVVLPACTVTRIRETFPSEEFVGFQYPNLD